MKLNSLILVAIGIGIGYLLASDDKDEIISDIKDGISKGKDFISGTLKKTVEDLADKTRSV